ncbi:energy transducer TonB [Paramagnetospirillum kuznetsovii]|uniref:Energy transducer TonB n=1 Tax=Paramagnetospirillum kuznetsovii TaxID=2053833 RepID=A0A364P1B2_9PROT|nr:energy transducer TonB [Paramagnetospirillum kuznetsovii]RAU22905.1 energy transducer TonB [Paramagnetospirillum kuznetsovii]
MKRGLLGTILWTLLAGCIGVGLFFIKHEVKDQERRLTSLTTEIQRNQETIHVLRAEWSYLNDPSRLRMLAEKHLGMHAVKPAEIASLDSVLRDGLASPTMMAAALPPRQPATIAAKPTEHAPKQQIKLAETPANPRPADSGKPPPPKPQQPKPGGVTVASGTAPPPTVLAAPAKGGHTIVVKSPALAQTDGGSR